MSDDDFLPSAQFTQQRSRQQAVTSTSRVQAWDMPGPSRGPGSSRGPGPSQSQPSQEELSQIQDRLILLMDRVEQLTGNRGIKRPAEQKPYDKKPDTKEQCQLCKKPYANKTTLFRHYRAIHREMNPEKYHGCSVNSTVVSLDTSFRENTCAICGYVATNQNTLDAHNRAVHSNVVNGNSHDANVMAANDIASVNSNNNADNGTGVVVASISNKENVNNNVMNGMHKCEECAGYFEKRNELDEHMKVQHGFEVVCKICNKNLLFKDYDAHVKDSHPDVYKKNEKIEKVIIEKVMKNKKGDRVHVFICTKCDIKMVDKIEAERHARGHKKGLKIKVVPRNNVSKVKENLTHVTPNNDLIILTCDTCDISTDSYDAAVEHSQNHITSTSNDIQFVTQKCLICELKFEPLCYKKHIDLHYKNKEIHKESFIYFKYRFQLLLSENWFYCFIPSKPIEDMLSRSIYEHTRSVKMRVTHEGTYKLYKCCQCDNFVEPAAVLNHTMNYDTCVKVKRSYECDICKRKFNSRLARNNHQNHTSGDNYKTVLFNHEQDKDFNKMLNDPNITHGLNNDADANAPKVYKCLCGVCFVRKENADKHKKICPGKDPKKSCPKCNNMFNLEELLTHCFEHHLNETRIVIENISPDAIVIDSDDDDDIIEIDSSDEDEGGAQTERFSNIKIEILRSDDALAVPGSSKGAEQAERQNMDVSETAITEAGENIEVASVTTLPIEKSEKDDMDENEDQCNDHFGAVDNEITEDDSQDTIAYENIDTDTDVANPAPNMNNHENLKCVPMNLLLNPLHIEKLFLNAEVNAGIETVRQKIETTNASVRFDTTIKQEKSWFDPTDFSNIRSRRSLRQTDMQPASGNLSQEIVELLLTDDEEAEMNNDGDATEMNDYIRPDQNNDNLNEGVENNDMCDPSSNISNTPMTHNVGAVVELLNAVLHTTNNEDITPIIHNEISSIERLVGENNFNCEDEHTELTEGNGLRLNISEAHSFHGEAAYKENNDQDHIDNADDLFVPSGIESREQPQNTELNVNEKEMPNNPLQEEQMVARVASANNKTHSCDNNENIHVDNTRICVENSLDDPEINENRSDENDIDNTKTNHEIDARSHASTEHIRSDYEDTQNFVESTPNETYTNRVINDIAENETASRKQLSKKTDINIKKKFGYINMKIKRELIEDSVQENGGHELVRIKTEPTEYSENKENDVSIINNNDVNYNQCSIC